MTRHTPYLVGLIGAGVGPSLTPELHMTEAAALGIGYVYRPIDLPTLGIGVDRLGELLDWVQRLGYDAVNVTHPCKQAVIPLLDEIDETARRVGAVNTVVFTDRGRIGYNTDTTGFERAFRTGMVGAPTREVVQLGAGGAGAAVADALLRIGVHELTIVDVDADRAGALVADLAARHPASVRAAVPGQLAEVLSTADGLVHCTPTGMAEHPGVPLDSALLREGLWVADIVYRPLDTALLTAARSAGCRTLDGGRMAVFQAVDAIEIITGSHPDPDRMITHFRSLVAPRDALV